MITRISVLLLATAATAFALTNEKVNKQFDAEAGGKLIVDVELGNVEVTAGADNKVSIEASRKIDSADEAKEKAYFAAAPITITQEGKNILLRVKRDRSQTDWNWQGKVKMESQYTIQVPKIFDTDLHTSGGGISVGDLTGSTKANTSGGELKFTHQHGPLDGKTNGGQIALNGCEGAQKIDTSGGGIEAIDGKGTLSARTSGGAIRVRNFDGDTEVHTSGGGLRLENIGGRITGKTSGGSIFARVHAPVADIDLETSAGSIELIVSPEAAFDLEASTSIGHVSSDLPFVAKHETRDHLNARLNGGGRTMILRSGAGSIAIKSSPEMAMQ